MFNDQEQSFLNQHRWATLTHLRSQGQPVSSMVAYARDGDQFVVSTPGQTFKRHSIERDGRVNLCVISNAEPFNFIAIEGLASITQSALEERTKAVFANIAGTGFELPEDLPGWLEQQQRVIVLITPQRHHTVIR
ncbi:MAG: pyridoxamine 5'-phosphate oxidase family protein [Pseudomonadales bacterium]